MVGTSQKQSNLAINLFLPKWPQNGVNYTACKGWSTWLGLPANNSSFHPKMCATSNDKKQSFSWKKIRSARVSACNPINGENENVRLSYDERLDERAILVAHLANPTREKKIGDGRIATSHRVQLRLALWFEVIGWAEFHKSQNFIGQPQLNFLCKNLPKCGAAT